MHPSYELRLGFLKAIQSTIGIERMQEKHFDMLDNIGHYADSLFQLEPATKGLQAGDEVQVIQGEKPFGPNDGALAPEPAKPLPSTKGAPLAPEAETLSTLIPGAPDPQGSVALADEGTIDTRIPPGMPDYEAADRDFQSKRDQAQPEAAR